MTYNVLGGLKQVFGLKWKRMQMPTTRLALAALAAMAAFVVLSAGQSLKYESLGFRYFQETFPGCINSANRPCGHPDLFTLFGD